MATLTMPSTAMRGHVFQIEKTAGGFEITGGDVEISDDQARVLRNWINKQFLDRKRFRLKCKRGHWKSLHGGEFKCQVCGTYIKKCKRAGVIIPGRVRVRRLERSI